MTELEIVLWNPRRNQSQCSVQIVKEGTSISLSFYVEPKTRESG